MIQFDFTPKENQYKPFDSPMDKKWMQFKEDLSMPRSMIDSTRVKHITGYIRAEPYTIWTKFGENPVYDVMPTIEKKWKIYWNINPNQQHRREYGRDLKPVPGETYLYVNSPAGPDVCISVDFDKLLYESLTKRGRAIKHNRTHAVALLLGGVQYVTSRLGRHLFGLLVILLLLGHKVDVVAGALRHRQAWQQRHYPNKPSNLFHSVSLLSLLIVLFFLMQR